MGSQCQHLANITNDDEIVRKWLFVKMERLVARTQQMVADPVAAKKEWDEMCSTMSLSFGAKLNKTEEVVEEPVGKKRRFASSNLPIDKRDTAPRKKPFYEHFRNKSSRK